MPYDGRAWYSLQMRARTCLIGALLLCEGACHLVSGADEFTVADGENEAASGGTIGVGGVAGSVGASGASGGFGGHSNTQCPLGELGACGENQKCTVVDEGTGETGCAPAGSKQAWAMCDHDAECVENTWCDKPLKVCKPLCPKGNECGYGNCRLAMNGALGVIPGLQVCTSYCNPITADPCDKTNFVTCIYVGQTFDCTVSKNYSTGYHCSSPSDCMAGTTCTGADPMCKRWCTPPGGASDCPPIFMCTATNPALYYDTMELGVCTEI